MGPVVVLFVEPDSVYKRMGLDCYDAARDARTWPGGCPVVAHPPCRTWGSLKAFAKSAPADEHALGPWAVEQVRRWGGVLEHPRSSTLFRECGCPPPDALPDEWGGWTLDVDQYHWGHKAKKATRLYIVGTREIPPIPRREGQPTHNLSRSRTKENRHSRGPHLPELSRKARAATPPDFARWLVDVANLCKHNIPLCVTTVASDDDRDDRDRCPACGWHGGCHRQDCR